MDATLIQTSLARSEKRISELDAERLSEVKALDEAKERLVRLEAEQAEVPKVVSSVQEAVPPVDWAAEVEIARGIGASARRSTILPKFLPGCAELSTHCPPIHKMWNGGYQKNIWSSVMPSILGTKSRFWQ